MTKSRKNKPALRPEGLAWLAQHANDSEWRRILDLHGVSLDALLTYVKGIMDHSSYRRFEEANLPPDVLAERRKAEAEKREAEEKAALTIYQGKLPETTDERRILDSFKGRGWKDATLTAAERAAEEKLRQEEASGLVEIPRPEW